VTRLHEWLESRGERLSDYGESWFYSDSINDLPLLSVVTHPVTVHPDDRLRAHAERAGWRILTLDTADEDLDTRSP
jgi:phosphoserine phosphatase